MNPILLIWKKRISYLVKLYYKFISFQIDGVILAYLLGIIGVLGFYYKDIITEVLQYLSIGYLYVIPQMILLLFLISGNLVGYLKLPDQVFLSPLNIDGKDFLKYSHGLSIGIHLLKWSVVWTILYFYYRINFMATVNLYLVILICGALLKITILNFKFVLWNKQGKWERKIYNSLFFSITSILITLILPILTQGYISKTKILIYFSSSIILLIISYLIKTHISIDWERLINEETNKRVQNFAFLLGQSSKEKKSSKRKTKSIFSGRKIIPFNPEGALLLLYFRILQRGRGNLSLLIKIYFAIIGGMVFIDQTVDNQFIVDKYVLTVISLIFIGYLIGNFLVSLWINIKEDIWFQIYPYTAEQKVKIINRGPTIVLSIFLLLLNLPMTSLNGPVLNPIIDSMGIIFLSIIIIRIHSFMLISKLNI